MRSVSYNKLPHRVSLGKFMFLQCPIANYIFSECPVANFAFFFLKQTRTFITPLAEISSATKFVIQDGIDTSTGSESVNGLLKESPSFL